MNIWPLTAHQGLSVGGVGLTAIAERFGTPAYVLDVEHIRFRCHEYSKAIAPHEVAYAAKAFWCRAMARWIAEEHLSLDVCSAGELVVAAAAGFPAGRILLHGNGKTPQELSAALDYGVGRIVLDSPVEVARLAALADRRQKILVRVTPGVDAHSHRAVTTGTEDQQFGLSIAAGAADDIVRRVLGQPSLALTGLHCHIGSQISGLDGFETAARRLVAFMAGFGGLPELNLGGGHAVPYLPGEQGLDITAFAERITRAVGQECAAHGIAMPRLTVEPGRAIVGSAGVTLYRVLTVKHGARTYVVVDGGMSDNPRPALYGSRYTIERVAARGSAETEPMTVVGRHCEAGDVLVRDAHLPADIRPGDLLAMPGTGAYHHAMASNYNLFTRPPVIAVHEGRAWPLIRRETAEDLLRRDVG
ncbi:MAG TPA: diaminopimelate decarboxylase [Streptosporangiaceae bacterium]|nr:diaminopimelate decarboxylase [Streptosporangiaceae bacterium]